MRIAVGSDHAGYEEPPPYFKPELMAHLQAKGHEVLDCGAHGPHSVDYPDFANEVANAITEGRADAGLLLCGTGIGVAMAANRHHGIRAAVVTTPDMARLSRQHNNANVLCLGSRVLQLDQCKQLLDLWLDTPFDNGERHRRRIEKIN